MAVSATVCPEAKYELQLDPQLMPDGVLVMFPVPEPDLVVLKE